MKRKRLVGRVMVEDLEPRIVLSASVGTPAIIIYNPPGPIVHWRGTDIHADTGQYLAHLKPGASLAAAAAQLGLPIQNIQSTDIANLVTFTTDADPSVVAGWQQALASYVDVYEPDWTRSVNSEVMDLGYQVTTTVADVPVTDGSSISVVITATWTVQSGVFLPMVDTADAPGPAIQFYADGVLLGSSQSIKVADNSYSATFTATGLAPGAHLFLADPGRDSVTPNSLAVHDVPARQVTLMTPQKQNAIPVIQQPDGSFTPGQAPWTADQQPSQIIVQDALTQASIRTIQAYDAAFKGGVQAVLADVNGDGTPDIITAPGVGGVPLIKMFDGATGNEIGNFYAFDPSFRGGVSLAAADFGPGRGVEIVVAPASDGVPLVRIFNTAGVEQANFFAYDQSFLGGVNLGTGDVNGDGAMDIITGTGASGLPLVRAYDGASGQELLNFYAFETGFRGGVSVAGLHVGADQADQIVVAPATGGNALVRVLANGGSTEVRNFYAANNATNASVYLTTSDQNYDGTDDIIVYESRTLSFKPLRFDGRTGAAFHDAYVMLDS